MRINEIIRYKRSGGQRSITLVIEESEALGFLPRFLFFILVLRLDATL
jgi:hypothetical protein